MSGYYTNKSRMKIATDSVRVVEGDRGAYIEFTKEQLIPENLYMPPSTKWRVKNKNVFYLEYRTKKDYVKIYYQRKRVNYADYVPGMFYISIHDIHWDGKPFTVVG